MRLYKLICHIMCFFKKIMYYIVYGKQIKIGKNVTWRKRFNLVIDKDAMVVIGDNCFFNNDCSINAIKKIVIGNGCLMGENVKIYDHNHRFRDRYTPIKEQGFSVSEVKIGNHCWIGSNVVILKGAQIGDNCVIGAGVVVAGVIKSNSILKNVFNVIERTEVECRN